jgi:hypothetical protein
LYPLQVLSSHKKGSGGVPIDRPPCLPYTIADVFRYI